ncbi:FUSC family protein [Rhodobacter lacus]|uniref:FUSC family protein n=1 Tax=Rhodobacter lacus TaxID=1641972 RepID=A0ABW5A4Y9_9RHOB
MTRLELWHAARLALAAWAAFAIATALSIEHAFWASMPVWVIAQPWRGVTLERALWRFLGTAVGGGLGLGLLALSPDVRVTAGALSLLLAGFAFCVHIWPGVRNYLPMMCAITLAVVVLPALLDPSGDLELARDRLACTGIGALCVVMIVGPFTPKADAPGFRAAGAALAARFRQTAALLLFAPDETARLDAAFAETLRSGAELETRARLVAAGSRDGYRRMAALEAILAAGLALLEAASLARRTPAEAARARALLHAPSEARVPPPPDTASDPMANALHALETACRELQATAPSGRALNRIAPPRNLAAGLRGAALAFCVSLAGGALVILTGSFALELAAFSMTVFALVLGAMPLPQPMAPKLGTGVVIGAATGVLYRLAVQPHLTDWPSLVLTIAPFILLGALGRANPRTAPYALDANMCFMLASQAGAAATTPTVAISSGVAMALGTLLVVACVMALPRPGARLIRRTEARLERDIRLLKTRSNALPPAHWTAIWSRRVLSLAAALESTAQPLPRHLLDLAVRGQEAIAQRHSGPIA